MGEQGRHLRSLTGLRIVAAMLVVLRHSSLQLTPIPGLRELALFGSTGVGFFFVLSGFVLAWADRGTAARSFYRRRFARVYPMHLVTLLAAVPLVVAEGTGLRVRDVVAGLVLVQAFVPSQRVYYGMNAVSWSLSVEALFYAVFPAIRGPLARLDRARVTRQLSLLCLGFLLVVLLGNAGLPAAHREWALYIDPVLRLAEFAAGILLADAIAAGWRPWPLRVTGVVAAGMFVGIGLVDPVLGTTRMSSSVADALMFPCWCGLIAAAARRDLDGSPSAFATPWMVRLGQWSFAVYLVHTLLIRSLLLAWPGAPTAAVPAQVVVLVALVAASVAVSGAAYTLVERPLEARLRGSVLEVTQRP